MAKIISQTNRTMLFEEIRLMGWIKNPPRFYYLEIKHERLLQDTRADA